MSDSRLDALGRAVDELRMRVAALERRAEIPVATPTERVEPASVPLATAQDLAELERVDAAVKAAPREMPAQPAVREIASQATPSELPLSARTTPDETRDASSTDIRNQVIGAAIGAFVGVFGGLAGFVLGALVGWAIVVAVQSHNRRVERDSVRYARGRRAEVARAAVDTQGPESLTQAASAPPEIPVQAGPRPAPAAPRAPAEPPESAPTWFQRLISGNIVAKIGVLILFFGVGFLLKYIYDHAVLPVPVRLAGVAAAGFGMIYIGWRLRERRRLYGLILQGGGVGLLYLDVYFALRVYNLIAALPGFAAFMGLGVAATLLAVRQNAKVLAVLGLTGAFLAPILASTKAGNHVALFSYYTFLNVFILAISWFKAWRDLNLVGFIFTFVVGVTWGAGNYRPENFATVEPFVLIFFAMYLVIPILFAQRQPPQLKGFVDGTLVFGTPLCAAFMQAWLVKDMPYGLAWSSGVAAGLYAMLAASTLRREGLRLLGETYAALAASFLTLAIFFAFDAYVTFALWTLEGAALFWVGLRQQRLLARLFGLALQIAGAVYFLIKYSTYDLSNPWWNAFVSGCIIIAAAGFITAWLVRKHRDVMDAALEPDDTVVLIWAGLWWSAAGVHLLRDAFAWSQFLCGLLAFTAFSVAAAERLGARLEWTQLRKLSYVHLPALLVIALMIAFGEHARLGSARPLADGGWWAWPLNFAVFFWIHARHARGGLQVADSVGYRGAWLLLGVIATWDVLWLIDKRVFAQALTWGGAGIAAAYLRFRLRERGRDGASSISPAILGWGATVWFVAGLAWIDHALPAAANPGAMLAFVAASCLAFDIFGSIAAWKPLRQLTLALPVGMVLTLIVQAARAPHPFAEYGWIVWPAAVAAVYAILRRQEEERVALVEPIQHTVTLWLAVAVATWEIAWQLRSAQFGTMWLTAAWGMVPAAALAAVSAFSGRSTWPFGVHYETTYRLLGLGPLAVWLGLWMIYANMMPPGTTHPLPYVPILNPLDLTYVVAFAALWRWSRTYPFDADSRSLSAPFFAGLGFVWVNCILMRTVHYWTGVEYEWHALMQSVPVQSGLSLLWTGVALVLMLYATRRRRRQLWIVGAALLAVVVLKLFVHDLGNVGTIARIVSFIGVGAGLLVIGYVAPVPPGDVERQAD